MLAFPGWFARHCLRPSASGGTADALASGASVRKDVGVQIPLAHQYDPGLTWGYMESAAGPESPWGHAGGTDSVRRPWHGMD